MRMIILMRKPCLLQPRRRRRRRVSEANELEAFVMLTVVGHLRNMHLLKLKLSENCKLKMLNQILKVNFSYISHVN